MKIGETPFGVLEHNTGMAAAVRQALDSGCKVTGEQISEIYVEAGRLSITEEIVAQSTLKKLEEADAPADVLVLAQALRAKAVNHRQLDDKHREGEHFRALGVDVSLFGAALLFAGDVLAPGLMIAAAFCVCRNAAGFLYESTSYGKFD